MHSFAFVSALLFASVAHGFAPQSMAAKLRSSVALSGTMALDWEEEQEYRVFLSKARECAYSDEGPIEEAKVYLEKILAFQSDCAAGGALQGEAICNNVDEIADTVAHLREKIETNRFVPG